MIFLQKIASVILTNVLSDLAQRAFKKVLPKKKKYKPSKIIFHCAATPDDDEPGSRWYELDISEIDKWHRARGWKGVGYNFFIKRDGTLQEGRPLGTPGAHTKGYNHEVGVCYAGTRNPSDAQKKTMRSLRDFFRDQYGLNTFDWTGHYKFANKDCPGFPDSKLHDILNA